LADCPNLVLDIWRGFSGVTIIITIIITIITIIIITTTIIISSASVESYS